MTLHENYAFLTNKLKARNQPQFQTVQLKSHSAAVFSPSQVVS